MPEKQPNLDSLFEAAVEIQSADDLSPLRGMALKSLDLSQTNVADLEPLRGMPLTRLNLSDCSAATDLAPLADSRELTAIILPPLGKDMEFLRAFPKLERISFKADPKISDRPDMTADEFWKDYDSDGWRRALLASGFPIKTIRQFSDGTWELNLDSAPIRDLTMLSGAPIRILRMSHTAVDDLEPLRGMALQTLTLSSTNITDLSPLQGMPLETLILRGTNVTDFSPIRGMPLKTVMLRHCHELKDISPLAECRELTEVTLPPNAENIEILRDVPTIARISFDEDANDGYRPNKTAEEFWKNHDAQKE